MFSLLRVLCVEQRDLLHWFKHHGRRRASSDHHRQESRQHHLLRGGRHLRPHHRAAHQHQSRGKSAISRVELHVNGDVV